MYAALVVIVVAAETVCVFPLVNAVLFTFNANDPYPVFAEPVIVSTVPFNIFLVSVLFVIVVLPSFTVNDVPGAIVVVTAYAVIDLLPTFPASSFAHT